VPGHVTNIEILAPPLITGKTSKVNYRYIKNNKTGNIKVKNLKVYNDVQGRLHMTQLKLQKNKIKKVILHCTTLTFWRCVAE